MSRQTVTLRVPIDDDWDAGDGLAVYTDYGTGTLDMDRPLTVKPIELFPGQRAAAGFGLDPFGVGRFGDGKASRTSQGFGDDAFAVDAFCVGGDFLEVTVDVPAAFGAWKFATVVVNRDGDPQVEDPDVVTAVVSGTEPPPLESFSLSSYEAGNDRATFDFVQMQE